MFVRIARWVPASGVLFVLLVVVSRLLTNDAPGSHAPDAQWSAYYADQDNRAAEEISFMLIGLAGFCFLSFLGSLRGALARAEGEPARLTTVVAASGTAFIALAVAAHGVGTATSWTKSIYEDRFTVDPNTARVLAALSFTLFVLSLFAAGAMTLAATVLAFQTGVLPRWIAYVGILATIAAVISILSYPSLVVLAWILFVSLQLLWPERGAQGAATRT